MNKWLILDLEMGGVELEYSLLTSYFLVVNDDFNVVDELELTLRPDDGKYIICGESMGVNKIDLYSHDLKAISYKEGGTKLYNWLKKITDDGKIKLNVVGKGIYGDIKFIEKYLLSRGSWKKFTSYHTIELSSVIQFLRSCGLFPDDVNGSLESLGKYFSISIDEKELHTAQYDTELTLKVFLKLREILINYKTSSELERIYYERSHV